MLFEKDSSFLVFHISQQEMRKRVPLSLIELFLIQEIDSFLGGKKGTKNQEKTKFDELAGSPSKCE